MAAAVLRIGLLIVFFAHGSQKLFGAFGGGGISGTGQYFASLGANPGELWAVLGGLVEFLGAIGLTLGLLTRVAAFGIALDMVGAVVLTNAGNGFFAEKAAGGWEINLILFCMAASLMATGAGAWSVDRWLAKRCGSTNPQLARLLDPDVS